MKVRKIITDYEKEEIWLNQMVSKGYALNNYTFLTYHFEACEPSEYQYRIQLLEEKPTHETNTDYILFLEELGVELVTSYYRWAYFRKKVSDGPFEIYSDIKSKIKHHNSIFKMQGLFCLANLSIGFSNMALGFVNHFSQYFSMLNISVALLLGILCFRNYTKIINLKEQQLTQE